MKLATRNRHRSVVLDIDNDLDLQTVVREVELLPDDSFDRYENPFEAKWTLRDKWNLPHGLALLMAHLEEPVMHLAETLFDVHLEVDRSRHYAGVFKYDPGDFLKIHVDAGIHPKNGMRKHVTAVCYLNDAAGGDLLFWDGAPCSSNGPDKPARDRVVYECSQTIAPNRGVLVLFENNDYAWHSVAPIGPALGSRYVATVSYLSNEVDAFANKRQRAFFVPGPGENWTEETYALRDQRSDPNRYADVYRSSREKVPV